MSKYLTASELTKMMIEHFTNKGNDVWRNNNLAVKGRTFVGRKGVPDIIGYNKKYGTFVSCEVKAIGDRLSKEQIEFLTNLGMANGIAMAVQQLNDYSIKLIVFKDGKDEIFWWNNSKSEFWETKEG